MSVTLFHPDVTVLAAPEARPDFAAHRAATALAFPQLVAALAGILGKKLTAYIGSAKDTRSVDRWMEGTGPYRTPEARLRLAYQVARTLADRDGAHVAQAWLTGLNPELNDRTPIRLLREGDIDVVGPAILGALRAYCAGG